MREIGEALAEGILEYLAARPADQPSRVLIVEYPREVQEQAARALIRLRDDELEEPVLRFQNARVSAEVAFIQHPDEIADVGLLQEADVVFGTSPDFPVKLRNRLGSVIVFCPPELIEACHESIKTNTFYRFEVDRRYGAPVAVIRRFRKGAGFADDAEGLSYIADELLSELLRRIGAPAWSQAWQSIQSAFSQSDVDFRPIGLLPSNRLAVNEPAKSLRDSVKANLAFQSRLVDTVVQGQRRIESEFGGRPGFALLMDFLADQGFRLSINDWSWRGKWPLNLFIEDLEPAQRAGRAVTISGLEIPEAESVGGLNVVPSGEFVLNWSYRRSTDHDIEVHVDGHPAANARLSDRSVGISISDSGVQRVELTGATVRLKGETHALVMRAPSGGSLLLSIGDSVPGAGQYAVPLDTGFQVRWWAVNCEQLEWIDIYVVSGEETSVLEDDDHIGRLLPTEQWIEIEEGISGVTVVAARAQTVGGALLEARVQVVPLDEQGGETRVAGCVAQALLDLATKSNRNALPVGSPERVDLRLLAHSDGYELTVETDDYANGESYRTPEDGLLAMAESVFLDSAKSPWPKLAQMEYRRRAVHWEVVELSDVLQPEVPNAFRAPFDEYVESRLQVLGRIADAGGIARVELSTISAEVLEYGRRYAELLESIRETGGEVTRFAALLSLGDALLVDVIGDDSPNVVLLSPTHPLRLCWLTQFELWVRRMFKSGLPWSPARIASLSSTFHPAHMIDWNLRHFVGSTTARSGTWLLMLPEDRTEMDQVVRPELARFLDVDSPTEAMAVSRGQIANAIRQYHELHPFKDALRIAYLGAGTGQRLREAFEQIIGHYRGTGVAGITANRLRLEVELLDVPAAAGKFDYATGQAFHDYAKSDLASSEVLERVSFGVRHLHLHELSHLESVEERDFNLVFGSELFQRRGRTAPLDVQIPPSCGGILVHTHRRLELTDLPTFRLTTSVPRPGTGDRLTENLESVLHRLLFAQQAIAAADTARRSPSDTEVRATVVELGLQEQAALNEMHRISEWVYLLDANVDVEYFDDPNAQDRYVLDYVPSFLAATKGGRQHSYLITSDDRRLIKYAINLFLRPYYLAGYTGLASDRDPADVVTDALNRLSGRQVFRLVGEPTAAKGSVGMALASLAYEQLQLTQTELREEFSTTILIPIDDYFDQWISDAKDVGFEETAHHGDLLSIHATVKDEEVILVPLVVEVKNRRNNYSSGDLVRGPYIQVTNTARLVEIALGLGDPFQRADRDLKNVELAELIDYHLRRRLMQQWGDDPDALTVAQLLRQRMYTAISSGAFSTHWPTDGMEVRRGAVLHFNSATDHGPTGFRPVPGEAGLVHYALLGLNEVRHLLNSQDSEAIEALRPLLDPSSIVIPDQTDSEPVVDSDEPEGGEGDEPDHPRSSRIPDGQDSGVSLPATEAPAATAITLPVTEEVKQASIAFAGFVGNDAAKERLIPWVAGALKQEPPRLPENLAFTGPASTGKTELCRRVARALGLPMVDLQGSAITSLDDLLSRMESQVEAAGRAPQIQGTEAGLPVVKYPPMVVFLDEAHEIRRAVQEQLLPLLEPNTRRAAGQRVIADVTEVTFIIATTDWGDLISTLQTRFQQVELRSYSEDEVTEIVQSHFPEWDREICRRIAVAGRLIPRQALQRAGEFGNALAIYDDQGPSEILEVYYEQRWEINREGLSPIDFEYLKSLDEAAGAVGLTRLATRLRKGEREVERNIEPFLHTLGLIEITPQGRSLSEAGKRYLRMQ